MSCAFAGCNRCWLDFQVMACPQCICPRGATTIWLAVSRVACSSVSAPAVWLPLSLLLVYQRCFWAFSNSWWAQQFCLRSMMAMLPSILSDVDQQRSKEHNTCPCTLNFDAQVSCFWLFHSADILCIWWKRYSLISPPVWGYPQSP